MVKLKISLIGLLAVVCLTSCVTTRVAGLLPSETERIELFTSKIPDKNYVELAYIQSDGAVFHTPQHLLNGLKKKAVQLDADAIINIKYDFQAWYPLASGTAIKYNKE